MATIITTHIPANDTAVSPHVAPGMRIQAIDIVQRPGIGISLMADMELHQSTVTVTLARKRKDKIPEKAARLCSGWVISK